VLRLPTLPVEAARAPFPILAVVTPVVMAGVIWAVTGSVFGLLFAGLSPIIAVAGVLDGRRGTRRRLRQESESYRQSMELVRNEVVNRHEKLRRDAWRRTPPAAAIVSGEVAESRWVPSSAPVVALGSGTVPSGLHLDSGGAAPTDLDEFASRLTDAPVTVDVSGSVGIIGPSLVALAHARAILVQLTHALPPGEVTIKDIPREGWDWTRLLPHMRAQASARVVASESRGSISVSQARHASQASDSGSHRPSCGPSRYSDREPGELTIALADTTEELPPGCATIVRLSGTSEALIVRSPVHQSGLVFRPDLLSFEQAGRYAADLSHHAKQAGMGPGDPLPGYVTLDALGMAARCPGDLVPITLSCPVGLGPAGPVLLDLVADGPHAVVGGTTGSGKSEFLVTWVTSMAARYPPGQVNFLLVDFKGGASFDSLRTLPHGVGVITDLGPHHARRALESLGAEVRHREQMLRDAGARTVSDPALAGALPRLVIVVDEFQALLDSLGELHALFADIAARGRSLGIHLVLCTQRPSGVVRDAVLANCNLRISLRVNNAADSSAVIGTDQAAFLSPATPGRCLVDSGSGSATLFQVATTSAADIRTISSGPKPLSPPRRPWLDPLPHPVTELHLQAADDLESAAGGAAEREVRLRERITRVAMPDTGRPRTPLTSDGYRFGLLDEPARQRYRVARYDPARDGHLLVFGASRSGKTTLLDVLAREAGETAERIPPTVEATWDALVGARRRFDRLTTSADQGSLLLFDDFDAVFGRWDQDYQTEAIEQLTTVLRDGPGCGLHVVLGMQRLRSPLAGLVPLCDSTVHLRLSTRQEHLTAGGTDALFDSELPPGGGSWRGVRLQVVLRHQDQPEAASARHDPPQPPAFTIPPDQAVPVVSSSPLRTAALLKNRGYHVMPLTELRSGMGASRLEVNELPTGTAIVADADAWLSQWTLLSALRARSTLVLDECSLADYRSVTRRRDLPPVLQARSGHVWLLEPDGHVHRARLAE
jgi:S-DNA-T family DNA segregation ATPase FtsK/SpoIIIE